MTDLLALLDLHDGVVGEDLTQVLHLLSLKAINVTQRSFHNLSAKQEYRKISNQHMSFKQE